MLNRTACGVIPCEIEYIFDGNNSIDRDVFRSGKRSGNQGASAPWKGIVEYLFIIERRMRFRLKSNVIRLTTRIKYELEAVPRIMLSNLGKTFHKLWPHSPRKLILIPLATLGILGFLINTHVSFISSSGGTCYPKTHIAFLKTHKCAGSSIQNILLRYGDAHGLTFALPRTGNYLGHPAPFSRTMVGPGRPFHLLAHHTRLSRTEISALLPRDALFVTVVRDPAHAFESSYSYYSLDKLFKRDIHRFARNLPRWQTAFQRRRFRGKFGANQMYFDLGGEPSDFGDEGRVLEHVRNLDGWFDLVMVAERMEESLVLLRHLLCWELDDVVAFRLNARDPRFVSNLTGEERGKLMALNRADALLYEHFVARFEREVEAFGRRRMAEETAELRRRTQDWYQLCVEGEQRHGAEEGKPKHYYNPKVMKFETRKNATNATCEAMTMEELPYTERLRQRQMKAHPDTFARLPSSRRRSRNGSSSSTISRTYSRTYSTKKV